MSDKHITYLEMSYPNFVLGQIIDPEEANQNNYDIQSKVNSLVDGNNEGVDEGARLEDDKADLAYVNEQVYDLSGEGRTIETIKDNYDSMVEHKVSDDHDIRYYNKTQLQDGSLDTRYYNKTQLQDGSLDTRYYNKQELIPWIRGGDTEVKEETYIIEDLNTGEGTFSYRYDGSLYFSNYSSTGGMIFELKTGFYELGRNRVEVIIDDTLRRSVSSGGVKEIDDITIELTSPEKVGTEITLRYFERVGFVAEYNIKLSKTKPPESGGKTMWFEILGGD